MPSDKVPADEPCLFCKLSRDKDNQVFATERVFVIVDRFPFSNRHLLVIPKEHHKVIDECSSEIVAEMANTAVLVAKLLGLASYNLLQNNINGQIIKHCHLHVIGANETGRLALGNTATLDLSEEAYRSLVKEIQSEIHQRRAE